MKRSYFTFIYSMDKGLFGENIETNPFFGTICVLFVAVLGAMTSGGAAMESMFHTDTTQSIPAVATTAIYLWGLNLAETIVTAKGWKTLVLRPVLLLIIMAVAFGLGALLAVVVIGICFLVLVGLGISVAASGNSGKKNLYLVDDYGIKTKVHKDIFGDIVDSGGNRYTKGDDGKYYEQ